MKPQLNNKSEVFFQVTRYIHHKIVGKMHDAKVVLALGNTLWIDPMVSVQFSSKESVWMTPQKMI